MRGSRKLQNPESPEPQRMDWRALRALIPHLAEFKTRIGLALLCLVGAKVASVGLPFLLKDIVDQEW